jgi:hypothetical protein
MHFVHSPAKLMEVDFAGDMLHYANPSSGELIGCPVFVAVLPFSGYAVLRNETFHSLSELYRAIRTKLDQYHQLNLQKKTFRPLNSVFLHA